MHAPFGRSRNHGVRTVTRLLHALSVLSLLIGLLIPLAPLASPAAAAQTGSQIPPPLPTPSRVALSGSFQTVLGCPADFDPTCPQTQLQDNRDGSWSAVLPVPAGDYVFRVVASSDVDRALGEGGDPNGADVLLSVPGNAAGVYFRYDSLTGDIVAEPVANVVTLVTDLGEQFAMAPAPGGGYEVRWDAQPGTYGFQVLFNAQPVTQDSVSLDSPSRVIVAVDESGGITTKDTLRDTRLDVTATDASGAPRPGSCFAILDRNGELQTQACDADDGQVDGLLRLRVPNGLDDGNYTLRETFTPDGGTPAEEQRIQLGAGRFEAVASTVDAGEQAAEEPVSEPGVEEPADQPDDGEPVVQPVTEPGDAPGRLTVIAVDDAEQPLPGACFAVVELGFEVCDDDGDGAIVFDAVPSAPLTLRETRPPSGFATVGDLPITIEPTGARLLVPHEPVAAEETPVEPTDEPPPAEPVETPQDAAGEGEVALALRDRDGNAVVGGCWALTERGGNQTIERCDGDDGAENGGIRFETVPTGRYRLDEVTTPAGYQPAESQNTDVVAGAVAEVTIEYQQARGRPGRLIILVADEDGNPVPQTCFDVLGPVELTEVCDRQDDGRLNVPDLPAGEYTVIQTRAPEGFTPASETSVVVPEDDTIELPLVNRETGTEDEDGQDQDQDQIQEQEDPVQVDAGRVVVTIQGEDGTLLPGACVALDDREAVFSICDDEPGDEAGEAGQIEIGDVAPREYTVNVTPPAGFAAPQPTTIRVTAGQVTPVEITLSPSAEEPENGSLVILAEDDAGNRLPAACYTVEIPPGGQAFGPFCDEDGDGEVAVQGVTPGPIAVVETSPPIDTAAAIPDRQEVEIVAGEEAEVVFRHDDAAQEQEADEEAVGTVEVRVVDATGQPVFGCVDLFGVDGVLTACDNDEEDTDDRPGQLRFDAVPPGPYDVELYELPEETPLPEARQIEVVAGETTTIEFAIAAGLGTLVIFVENEEGERIGGACFTLRGDSEAETLSDICDQGDDGRLNFPDLPSGAYTIVQTRAGENRQLAPEQTVTVEPGQTVEITVSNPAEPQPATPTPTPEPEQTPPATPEPEQTPTPTTVPGVETPAPTSTPEPVATAEQPLEETGVVELTSLDDEGNPIPDQCYTLIGSAGNFGPFCDNGEGDTSGEPGILVVEGLPVGTYEAVLETTVDDPEAEEAQQAKPHRSVSVRRGGRETRTIFNVRAQQRQRGDLLIRVRDQDGSYLAGACFGLIENGATAPSAEVCDNGGGDENTADGRILLTGIRSGRYTLTQSAAPSGYSPAADQSVRIAAGSVREVAFTNQAVPEQTATLDVETVDSEGTLLLGACYEILRGNSALEACDVDSGEDGITRFAGIASGSYVVRQVQPPPGGYVVAGATSTLVSPGQSVTVTVVNETRPGSLVLRKTDAAGQLLAGACFALRRGDQAIYTICDNDASDANTSEGVILLGTVAPGTYTLRETQPPAGYLAAADQEVTISANQRSQVSVVDALAPEPERFGDLRVFKVTTDDRALAGSCFAILDGEGQVVVRRCDAEDGADNGVILMEGIAPGEYTLRETQRPSADYETAPDILVEIIEDQTVDVEVVNRLRPGRIFIRKTDPNGLPLTGACFDVVEDGAGAACTDAEGELVFSGLAPGVYRVVETEAPAGYLIAPAIDPVTVRPGSTATLDVVDQPAPPPPDSGSIQVRKFVCPAAAGGGGIAFVDSSDPDGGGLARTAGCDVGDAAFVLDGPSGPIEFRTGSGGRYQTTLDTGDYVLTELSTGAAEELTVRVNTLTTVVVVNYVEPEGEQPAAIDIVKYTCAPGFQGRVWLDFAEACLGDETRTNNVGFRLSGAVSARRVTGDAGTEGATRFDGLPAGDYQLREETPLGTVAVYAFCGVDPASPDGRGVGDAVNLRLAAGQTVTCHWFNVPEDLAGDTGAITVYKYACPVTVAPATFDWYGRCDPQGQGVEFSLSAWDGDQFLPVTNGITDGDGILRFTRLQPGTYDLEEVNATWCHAESDSVNARGEVVVEAGERSSVWIFNCVGAKNPPNTGAGPMWSGGVIPSGSVPAAGLGLSLLWPLAGLVILRRWGRAG